MANKDKQGSWRINVETQELLRESLKEEIVRRGGETVSMAEWIDIVVKRGLEKRESDIKSQSD